MIKDFIYAEIAHDVLILKLDSAKSFVLWNKKGMYGLIPFAKIQNAFDHWKDTHIGSTILPTAKFHWHDVIPISLQIANALLGENKDNKCTYRGKSGPQSS